MMRPWIWTRRREPRIPSGGFRAFTGAAPRAGRAGVRPPAASPPSIQVRGT